MMRWLSILVAAACAGAIAAEQPADHAAIAPLAASAPDGLQRVHLPLALLQQSRAAALADLRVFNDRGEPLAFGFVPVPDERRTREAALPRFGWPAPASGHAGTAVRVQVDAAGAVVRVDGSARAADSGRAWLLDASSRADDERLASVTLQWERGEQPLVRQATLEGSEDFAGWRVLAHATLVDLEDSGARVVRDAVALDEPRPVPKYLRLRVDGPLDLRTAHAQWRRNAAAPLDSADVRFERAADGPAAWRADLGVALRLRSLRVTLPQPNSVAVLWLEQRDDSRQDWRSLGRHTLYRLTRDARELVAPPIEIDAPAARHWRLRLDDRSPPLAAPVLEAELRWPPVWIVLAGRGPGPLVLAIGREKAVAAALPLSALLPGKEDASGLPETTVGSVRLQTRREPGWIDELRDAGPAQRRRWVLWAVLALAVGGLAWLARGLAKDLKGRR